MIPAAKAIILDMYGVILKEPGDSFYEYVRQTFPELSDSDIYSCWDLADQGVISSLEVFKRLGYQGDLEQIQRKYLDTIELDSDFPAFAGKAKARYKLALLSNDTSEWSSYLREKFKLNPFFDVLAVSGDLKMKKPDRRIFRYVAEQLGCSPTECVYIDDRRRNLEAAQQEGMHPVLFNRSKVEYFGECVNSFGEFWELLTDFSSITACGECCVGCPKKLTGICKGCIEADGYVPEWSESGQCKVHACAKKHNVSFCGLCSEFPCADLTAIIHWNPDIVEHLSKLAERYRKANEQ